MRRRIDTLDDIHYKYSPWVTLYWRMRGLYSEYEVWLMSDAYKKDRYKQLVTELQNNPIQTRRRTHGMTVFEKGMEEVLCELPPSELNMVHDVKSILDEEYSEEMSEAESLYYAIEYIRYLRWLKYAIKQGEGQLRSQHVSYEKTVGKKMFQMFERLDSIRLERAHRESDIVDFEVEVLPEEEATVKKVNYEYETTAAEEDSKGRDAGSNRELDE